MEEKSTDRHPLSNLEYDWITLMQNKAQALIAYDQYIKDAEQANSPECATFFRKVHDADKAQLAEAREKGEFGTIPKLSKDLAFHVGGVINHSIFWKNMSPEGGDKPEGELAAALDDAFGSFDAFRAHFTAAATSLQGSGWAVLAYEPLGKNIVIEQLYDQQGNVPVGTIPLLMLDMWEHAFYLDYVNVKPEYVKAWWNLVNWADVQTRFQAARTGASSLITPGH